MGTLYEGEWWRHDASMYFATLGRMPRQVATSTIHREVQTWPSSSFSNFFIPDWARCFGIAEIFLGTCSVTFQRVFVKRINFFMNSGRWRSQKFGFRAVIRSAACTASLQGSTLTERTDWGARKTAGWYPPLHSGHKKGCTSSRLAHAVDP